MINMIENMDNKLNGLQICHQLQDSWEVKASDPFDLIEKQNYVAIPVRN